MIRIENVWKKYSRHEALRGLSFSVPEGSAFALIGANGAGKTTTIKILMNIIEATGGSATVLGVDSRRLSPRELARIGYVSENQDMPDRLTVSEYLDYLRPLYPTWDRSLEISIRRRLQLPGDRRIRDLSHGMRMKMTLAYWSSRMAAMTARTVSGTFSTPTGVSTTTGAGSFGAPSVGGSGSCAGWMPRVPVGVSASPIQSEPLQEGGRGCRPGEPGR